MNGAVGTATLGDGRPFAIAGFAIETAGSSRWTSDPARLSQLDLTILD